MMTDPETATVSAKDRHSHDLGRTHPSSTSAHDFPSEAVWSVYISEASKYDKALAEGWKDDMDSILIFAGLFSASVTAFIIEGYQSLQPNQGDLTIALLAQISQQLLAASNGVNATLPSPMPTQVPFLATSSAIRVNVLWFLSLAFSLACALAATLVKQWSRNYLDATRRRPTPYMRARIRSYLFEGLQIFRMRAVVDAIPLLLHIALFLFLTGLYEFLLPINYIIAQLTLGIIVACAALYLIITIYATFFRNCPYVTPISGICWIILRRISTALEWLLRVCKRPVPEKLQFIPDRADRMMEEIAMGKQTGWLALDFTSVSMRDQDALRWTVESLTSNGELEPFVEGIAGFLVSRDIGYGDAVMWELLEDKNIALGRRIGSLLGSCSEVLAPIARQRRAVACITAIWSLTLSALPTTKIWYSGFDSSTLGGLEQRLTDHTLVTADWAKCTLSVVLCRVLQDMWNSSAGAAGFGLSQNVDDLLKIVNIIQRCAELSPSMPAKLWETLSTRISRLLAEVESVEHAETTVPTTMLLLIFRQSFVQLLLDARILSLVNVLIVLMEMSFDPFAFMKRPSGVKQQYTPFSPTDNSEYQVLRHLRRDLTARSRDPEIQACFIETMGKAIDTEERKGGRMKLHHVIIEDLLVLMGTVDESSWVEETIHIVRRYKAMRPESIAVGNALDALKAPRYAE